jgi:ArsR family transcriptional regulator
VRHGDAAALPWDDATFDSESNLAALFFAADPPAVLREAARVLKPSGRFVVVTMPKPEREDVGTRLVGWFLHKARLYSDDELAQHLRDAGFETVEVYSPSDDAQVGYAIKG